MLYPVLVAEEKCKTISKLCQECCDGTSPRSPKVGIALSFLCRKDKKVRFFNKMFSLEAN